MAKVLRSFEVTSPVFFGSACEVDYDTEKILTHKVLKKVEISVKPKKKTRLVISKAIRSGNILELYLYENSILKGFEIPANTRGKPKKNEDEYKRRLSNIVRSKMRINRLINANVTGNDSFITFTFKENICDIDIANSLWKCFIDKWNKRRKRAGLPKLNYVAVIEFQKRGAIHYHCCFFNIEYVPHDYILRLWGNGSVNLKSIKDVDNVGAYITYYLSKETAWDNYKGKKIYQCSRGLKKPQEKEIDATGIASIMKDYQSHVVYKKDYLNTYDNSKIHYLQINLKR